MPHNEELPNRDKHMKMKTGEKPSTEYINALEAINVDIINAPSLDDLRKYIPSFATGTWSDTPNNDFSDEERDSIIKDLFSGSILPTAYESIKITYRVDGLDMIDVTHLIRGRLQGYSAQATGDRDMRNDSVLIKPSILGSKYEDRYKDIIEKSKQLYADMMDDKEIPILDPRTILPKCTSNFYFVTSDLKTIMNMVRQRKDQAIQPESDNIFALKLWIEVCKIYPMIKDMIDFEEPDRFAIKSSIEGRSSDYYLPSSHNDIYDYNRDWFVRSRREEMRNGSIFIDLKSELLKELKSL